MIHRLIAFSVLAAVTVQTDDVRAQDALPTPSAEERIACSKGFAPLYGDVTKTRWLIQHSTGRLPSETCKLVGDYSQAELKMIEYLETHAAKCGITPKFIDQLKEGHKKTEVFRERVCLDAKPWPEGRPYRVSSP